MKPSLDSFVGEPQTRPPLDSFSTLPESPLIEKPKKTFLEKAGNVVNSIFPGKQVGEAIGTLAGAGIAKLKGNYDQYDLSAPTPKQVAGDVAQGALTVATPAIGGETAGARILGNAAVGAGIGASGTIAEGKSTSDALKQGALGGAIGGGLSAAGEGLNYLGQNLPKWFTKVALPKMKDPEAFKYVPNSAGGYTKTPQESAAEYALNNTKGLSVSKMLEHSNESVSGYNKQIQTILSHPEYTKEVGEVRDILPGVMDQYPNTNATPDKIIGIVRRLAPRNANLVDKVASGQANLAEQNTLRRELDKATKVAYGDHPNLSFQKEVGKKFADALRANVQKTATETIPVFAKWSKEINLNTALQKAVNKKTVAGDLLAGGAGFAKGGIKGAAEAILIERGLRSPSAQIAAAKGIKGAAKYATPVVNTAFKAGKAALIKKATDSQK